MLAQADQLLCTRCRLSLPETNDYRSPDRNDSHNKFAGKVPVRYVMSYARFSKGSVMQRIIHQIKYGGNKDAATALGRWYGAILTGHDSLANDIDMLVGVPLHKQRLRQRGYNQADQIASGLSEAMHTPARTDVLVRTRFKSSQTKKNRLERWANVSSVFTVADAEAVKDKHVAIVDDVLTTGATIEACAVELLRAGCREVSVITLAVTQ
ncbi:ComF family protein [Spirosoma rhododendri]|uniref:ComF family protein n=2 Tax=Spirosoma rhododendri TaxID=2728024 RepID=A0A7L5DSZ3_9BACT|nr:ComF family protein [Spirosoma rhododendri]